MSNAPSTYRHASLPDGETAVRHAWGTEDTASEVEHDAIW